jgi:uncharacterized membrane-anchored protein
MSETRAAGSTGQDRATRDYVAELTVHLVRTGLDGRRVGEVLAEVEAHVDATGEPAREAFGPPREYARRWAPDLPPQVRRRRRLRWLAGLALTALVAAGFGALLAQVPVASDLAAGGVLLAGTAAIGLVALVLPHPLIDRITDPRTGRAWSGTRSARLGAALVLTVLLVIGLVLATGS